MMVVSDTSQGCSAKDDNGTQQQQTCILQFAELPIIIPIPFTNRRPDILQMHFPNRGDEFQTKSCHGTGPIRVVLRTLRKTLLSEYEDDRL